MTTLFAILLALALSVVLALCLPMWASLSIALAAVASVIIGGEALLAKASAVGAVVGVAVWLSLRYWREREAKRMSADVKWLAIPAVKKNEPKPAQGSKERRAA